MNVQDLSSALGLVLQLCNIIIIGYGLFRFLNKPHDTLEEKHEELVKRVDKQENRIEDIEESLLKGNDKFRSQEETNASFKSVMLSFVNFEIAYCIHTGYEHTEDLMNAKHELESYLAGKKHHEAN